MERNNPSVDFHVHYKPEREESAYDAIDLAVEANVKHIALLARSEVSPNFNQFKMYGETVGVKVETGVELCTSLSDQEVGLVGLGFDDTNDIQSWLGNDMKKQKSARLAKKQLSFLQSQGFNFDNLNGHGRLLSNLLSGEVTEKAINFCKIASDIPENAEVIKSIQENSPLWTKVKEDFGDKPEYKDVLVAKFLYYNYFAHGKPGNNTPKTGTKDAVERIQRNGGVALYSPEGNFNIDTWNKLKDIGIDGIMAWHGDKMELDFNMVKEIRSDGFLVLGGSDYQERDWKVGTGSGAMYISERRGAELSERLISNKEVSNVS